LLRFRNSRAAKADFEQGVMITAIETGPDRPAKEWVFIPVLALLGVILLGRRRRFVTKAGAPPAGDA
jgi:MYXO-CTERM domain-containing protein